MSFKSIINFTGWFVFAVAAVVLGMSAEPTGSLWDCGEFIAGAYKLQVVHPPGAPMFLLIGRLFAWVGEVFYPDDPEKIAYMVNLLSAVCTAFGAMFVCWSTIYLAKIALVGRQGEGELEGGEKFAVAGAGLVAGLTTAFLPSIWFSAVEGEVYAMSFFFTCLTVWAVVKWYYLPDNARSDRWLVFAIYATGLSIGVHLLSLLTFPALALFYYFKKAKNPTTGGALLAALGGTLFIGFVQTVVIVGIPSLWASFDKIMVNNFGMPFNSGLIPVILLYGGVIYALLNYAHKTGSGLIQKMGMAFAVLCIAYTCYGTVVIRANANPPINMNNPSDPMRLLPYLNREQYGERPLLRGPNFDAKPVRYEFEDRYGRVGDKYEVVDDKVSPVYSSSDKVLFPRMGDYTQGRPALYRRWVGKESGSLSFGDNLYYFFRYQIGHMYWRYFMWNFAGRQNDTQAYFDTDVSDGNWLSGIDFVDEMRLASQENLPDTYKNDMSRNTYFYIPFILGLIGLVWFYIRQPKEFAAMAALFIITGIGITVYSNQPPSEPRERDYVLVGSFFVYAMWIGLAVLAVYDLLKNYIPGVASAGASVALGMLVPTLMLTQNMDDYSRAGHYGARDYASNFLNSCEENAIIFTYGDNDTYPLWYAQEVEGIRTDVRVVNLSLIAVDWYIEQLRRKVNNSAPIKLSIPEEQYRGFKRVQTPFFGGSAGVNVDEQVMDIGAFMKFLGEDHNLPTQGGNNFDTYAPAKRLVMPVNKEKVFANNYLSISDSARVVDAINFKIADSDKNFLMKDELAILDIIYSNAWERPIYWAVTCRSEKLLGLQDYTQLEGLSLRLVPVKSQSNGRLGIVGSGRVATDFAFRNIMEKWRWGNFDTHDTHINTSYMPSVQTMRIAFIRTAESLLRQGDKERTVQLLDKYFEAFPHFNFPYDYFTTYLVDLYAKAGANEQAKKVLDVLAEEARQHLTYFESIDPSDLRSSFQDDQEMWIRTVNDMFRIAESQINDAEYTAKLDESIGKWKIERNIAPQTAPID